MEKEAKYLTVKQVAEKAAVTEWTVRRWIREERLPARKKKYGKNFIYLIDQDVFNDFMQENFRIL